MTSFKFIQKSTPNKNGEKTIAIQIIRNRENTALSIYQSCLPKYWEPETQRVKGRSKKHKRINAFIEKYEKIVQNIIDQFELSGDPYDLKDVSEAIKNYKDKGAPESYSAYVYKRIELLKKRDKISSYKLEEEALSVLFKFFGTQKIKFKDINYNSLGEFVAYLEGRGNTKATIGIRLRTIRANFNKALSSGVISEQLYPFKEFKISKFRGHRTKQILTEGEMKILRDYDCQNNQEQFAKDMFLLSYYARGINFVDIMLLKKRSVTGSHVDFIRQKTGVHVRFDINRIVEEIFNKYKAFPDSIYLLNIIQDDRKDQKYIQHKNHNELSRKINPGLKSIMANCGINKHITYYCARHSFATVLKFNEVPIETIREALGHKDIKSTMSYLATLPDNKLDDAINRVLFKD